MIFGLYKFIYAKYNKLFREDKIMVKGRPIWLAIESEISYEPDDAEVYTLQTEGRLFERNNILYIVYEESEISGMKGDKTLLKVEEKVFSMKRYGEHASELVFIPERETSSIYQTPQGVFSMFCYTKELEMSKDPFQVEVKYNLTIEGLTKSSNRLKLYFLDTESSAN